MNLEALAVRRAEEQMRGETWRAMDVAEREFVSRSVPQGRARSVSCACGKCRTCRNRAYMTDFRAGLIPLRLCAKCGKVRIHRQNESGWCSRCRNNRPGEFKRRRVDHFRDGGGI